MKQYWNGKVRIVFSLFASHVVPLSPFELHWLDLVYVCKSYVLTYDYIVGLLHTHTIFGSIEQNAIQQLTKKNTGIFGKSKRKRG